MENRVYNFSAGPAVLPLPVLKKAQEELLCLPGVGSSVLEISHRSKPFMEIIEQAEANLRTLYAIPDNYKVLFLQGGAQLQFAMIPMNIMQGNPGDYILTGSWGKKAMGQAKTQGQTNVIWDGADSKYSTLPTADQLTCSENAAYVHITSNETIEGVQFADEPEVGDTPLVCDSSSDILCRPVDIAKYGVLYACAQKNAGPAGVTAVIIRDDLLERTPEGLPSMLDLKTLADKKSLLNTPPCFSIYILKLVTDWLLNDMGGLAKMHEVNKEKAGLLYSTIDASDGYYIGHASSDCRSIMNVSFRMQTPELDAKFIKEASAQGLTTLKGHRSVGGCRASIYNAMPREGVVKLRDFMVEFQKNNG
jgi:phosphoserine aminotransferase